MKKILLIMSLVVTTFWLWSCDNEKEDLSVQNLQTYIIVSPPDSAANVVVLTAVANNALSYTWDLGIDSTATGMQVTVHYPPTDSYYLVKCTAKGATGQISVTDTVRWN